MLGNGRIVKEDAERDLLTDPEVQAACLVTVAIPWRTSRGLASTRAIGDAWVARGDSAVLQVPSRVVPEERNYLINPLHPDMERIRTGPPRPFRLEPDLVTTPRPP